MQHMKFFVWRWYHRFSGDAKSTLLQQGKHLVPTPRKVIHVRMFYASHKTKEV